MSDPSEEPQEPLPLRPVHPPDPPSALPPSGEPAEKDSGLAQAALGFAGAIAAGLVCLFSLPAGLLLVLVAVPVFGIILSVPASTRKFGLGMLLAFGLGLLILLAICGGALARGR